VPTIVSCCCVVPLHFTWEPPEGSVAGRKFEPLRINVRLALPASAFEGLMLVRLGRGFGGGLILKGTGLERPLFPWPEAGFRVMTVATPGLATSAMGTIAVSFTIFPALLSVGVVVRGLPFHCTTVLVTKPLPVTVSVKSAWPALIREGEREVIRAPVLP